MLPPFILLQNKCICWLDKDLQKIRQQRSWDKSDTDLQTSPKRIP